MKPFGIEFDLVQGIMKNPDNHLVRRASDMRGYYSDDGALEELIDHGDPVHYEVFEKEIPEQYGHLRFCISSTQPGTIGGEYFMTKGHYHTIAETAEIYLCLRGQGYMLMKTSTGEGAYEKFVPGQKPLISFCVYPGNAGHNYGDIKIEGFPMKVVNQNGRVVFQES
jgi:glucose-6-phosphate isomerase